MLPSPSPTVPTTKTGEQTWVSPNEGIEHAPDPNNPDRIMEGGLLFGGVRYDGIGWLDGSRGPYAPTKEVK